MPGRVLPGGGGEGVAVVRLARAGQRQGRDGLGEAPVGLIGQREQRVRRGPVGRGGERRLRGQYGHGVGDGVEARGAERLEGGGVGAGTGEGDLPFQQGAGARGSGGQQGFGRVGVRCVPGGRGGGTVEVGVGGEALEGAQQPVQPCRSGVLAGQRAGQPGQFAAQVVGPPLVRERAEGVQRAADPPGGGPQLAGRLPGALRVRAALAMGAQAAQEVRRPVVQVGGEDVTGGASGQCGAVGSVRVRTAAAIRRTAGPRRSVGQGGRRAAGPRGLVAERGEVMSLSHACASGRQ